MWKSPHPNPPTDFAANFCDTCLPIFIEGQIQSPANGLRLATDLRHHAAGLSAARYRVERAMPNRAAISATGISAPLTRPSAGVHRADGAGATSAGKSMKAVHFKSPEVVKASDDELIADTKNGKGKMPAYAGKLTDAQKSCLLWWNSLRC
jgi:hypothetical protein